MPVTRLLGFARLEVTRVRRIAAAECADVDAFDAEVKRDAFEAIGAHVVYLQRVRKVWLQRRVRLQLVRTRRHGAWTQSRTAQQLLCCDRLLADALPMELNGSCSMIPNELADSYESETVIKPASGSAMVANFHAFYYTDVGRQAVEVSPCSIA